MVKVISEDGISELEARKVAEDLRAWIRNPDANRLGPVHVALYALERPEEDLATLRVIAEAASNYERTLAKMINADQTSIKSTDLGAEIMKEALNNLYTALKPYRDKDAPQIPPDEIQVQAEAHA